MTSGIPRCSYWFDGGISCGAEAGWYCAKGNLCYEHKDSEPDEPLPLPVYDGMPATLSAGSDRYAYTVVWVSKAGKKLLARMNKVTRVDNNGMSEDQEYTYEEDPEAEVETFHRNGHGGYGRRGRYLHLGYRKHYHDYSF